ncbi:MAG: hypothetical protein ACFFD4_28260 [Candidatus Odinarchaeota archaeon]
MNHKKALIGIVLAGLFLSVTVATVSGFAGEVVPQENCDGLGPHGQANGYHVQGNGTHEGPRDGSGNRWGSEGSHGDQDQTCQMP